MQFDIETTVQDNVRLKKALQMTKFSYDKLQKQYKQLKQLYDQSNDRNKQIKNDYCDLQKKYQQSFSQSLKDNNALISQIQQLKKLIDQKQRDMEQLQIKIIPSLDQDMLRVKLITQMQGPYQQTIDKKDKQIQRLKHKISQLQRGLQISNLSLKSKVDDIKKQRDYIKQKYEQQTSRLMKELNISLSRNQVQSVESSIIKNQRKQIQQLKYTLQFISSNQQKHLTQIKQLKYQRNQLLQKLMQSTGKQALLLQGKHNLSELQRIKQDKQKLSQQVDRMKIQVDKQTRQINKLQQQKTKLQNDFEQQVYDYKNRLTSQRNQHSNQLYELKQQLKRLKSFKIQNQTDRNQVYEKIKYLEKQLHQKSREVETLRLQNSRYSQRGHQPGCWDVFCKGNSNEKQRQKQKQNNRTVHNKPTRNQKIFKNDKTDNYEKKYLQAEKTIQKLKRKLSEANQKILELLKGKMKNATNISPQRDRAHSKFEKPVGVFLQYEDCGFKPLVQPTLYTYTRRNKK